MNTIPNSIMSALIVDFPREHNRKVHFSSMSDLWVYERDDGKDKSKIWYSEEEYVRMKLDFKRSILNKYEANRVSSDGQVQVDASGSGRRSTRQGDTRSVPTLPRFSSPRDSRSI